MSNIFIKSATALSLTFILSGAAFAAGSDTSKTVQGGTIHFQGSVIDAACSINASDVDKVVIMGQIKASTFKNTADTLADQKTPFTITLTDCDPTVAKQAAVTFNGSSDGDAATQGVLANTAGLGGAAGVGLQIFDKDGSALPLGTLATAADLLEGDNTMNFSVDYISTRTEVGPGEVKADATFTVTYS